MGEDTPTPLGEPGRRQIGWLELGRDFNIVHEIPDNPILAAGEGGAFDWEGVVMPMVVRLSDRELYMYYAGFGPGTAAWLDNHAGLAVSRDGGDTWTRWSRAPLPVRDDKQTEYAIVLKDENRYLMFYNGNGYGRTGTGLAVGTPQSETNGSSQTFQATLDGAPEE